MEFNARFPRSCYHTPNLHNAEILTVIELALCDFLYIKMLSQFIPK
ncbi:hypothetical protein AT1219_80040 [Vibrio alginolyticus]